MRKNILKAPFIKEIGRIATYMYNDGWDERNAGNISYLLYDEDVLPYLKRAKVIKEIPIGMPIKELAEYRLVVWSNHGIYGTGGSMDETYGLIEVMEKSAKMFVLKQGSAVNHVIPDQILLGLAKQFNVQPKKGVLKI